MTLISAFKSSNLISWKSTGKLQQTIASCIERTGKALHSGKVATVKISPDFAGEGRYFKCRSVLIPASIDFALESPLCTTLRKDGHSLRTVEHLLSALEAAGVDNCRIDVTSSDSEDQSLEKNDSFLAAFPSSEVHITYGINFRQVPAIGCQWFFSTSLDNSFYAKQIAPSRTFCVYEEVEQMRNAGLIKGGSIESAIVCSSSGGWLNPPLHFQDEPCRHKVLDLIGDLSLLARCGSQGLPVAQIVAYKGGHALHADLVRCLLKSN